MGTEGGTRRGFSGSPSSGVAVGDQVPHPNQKQPPLSFSTPSSIPQAWGWEVHTCGPFCTSPGGVWVPCLAKGLTDRTGMAFPRKYNDIWAHAHPSDENIRPLKRKTEPCSLPDPQNPAQYPGQHMPAAKYVSTSVWRTLIAGPQATTCQLLKPC